MNLYQNRMQELGGQIVRESQGVQPISLTESEILFAEETIGQRFQEDYRVFLKDFGCYQVYAFFPCKEELTGWGHLSLFYGITPLDSHPFPFDLTFDLLDQHETFKEYLPPELLPIGDNLGNN